MNLSDMASTNKKFQKELSTGTVSLVLLGILGRATEPLYGYQIARQIEGRVQQAPLVKQGALYPVLRALERSRLLSSEVEPSVSGPPRRYYTITESGREILGQWTEIWNKTKTFVDDVLKGTDYVE
jgi:PadR family transcriptional regulator PadR